MDDLLEWRDKIIEHKTAIFRQINKDKVATHHDALEFPDGQTVLLTKVCEGQQATVLQLPAEPKTAVEAQSQRRVALRRLTVRTGLLVGVFAWITGLQFPVEWGVIAFALNYIPYIGPLIATLFPTLLALRQFESWQAVLGNYIDRAIPIDRQLVVAPATSQYSPRSAANGRKKRSWGLTGGRCRRRWCDANEESRRWYAVMQANEQNRIRQ